MQDEQLIKDHYEAISSSYDQMYESRYDELASFIIQGFDLQPSDVLVDFGGGTGAVANLCWKKGGLCNNVLVVDPSSHMLKMASSLEGVTPIESTCEAFMQSDQRFLEGNCFVFCRSFHHVPNFEQFLTDFYNCVAMGTKLMIIEQSENYLWKSIRGKSRPFPIEKVEAFFYEAGFVVSKTIHVRQETCVKSQYFEDLRSRVYSILKYLSDEEIEKGLEELDKDYFKFKESIEVDVKTIILTAIKQ